MPEEAQSPCAAPPTDGFVLLGQADPPTSPELPEPDELVGGQDDNAPGGLPAEVLDLGALLSELDPIRPEQVVLTLRGAVGGRLADRAAFLGMIPPHAAESVADERDWSVMLGLGLSVSQLCLLVQSEPWLPPVIGGVPFCSWLVERGLLDEARVAALYEQSVQLGWPLFQVALEQGAVDEATYVVELARFSGLEQASAPVGPPRGLVIGFPLGWVQHFELVPLGEARGVTQIAVSHPLPEALMARLVSDLGGPVEALLAAPSDVAAWRRRWLRRWWELHRPAREG